LHDRLIEIGGQSTVFVMDRGRSIRQIEKEALSQNDLPDA
jgi:hypothetical protein